MKENALKCKAIDSEVKEMHGILGTKRKDKSKEGGGGGETKKRKYIKEKGT